MVALLQLFFNKLELLKNKLDHERKEKDEALDKLDISERNCSKVKTEYMTEKASWEIKTAEMQTKINEVNLVLNLDFFYTFQFQLLVIIVIRWQSF